MKRKMLRKGWRLTAVPMFAALILALTACGADSTPTEEGPALPPVAGQVEPAETGQPSEGEEEDEEYVPAIAAVNALAELDELIEQFPVAVVNNNTPIEGGTLRWASVSDSPFPGILLATHSTNVVDTDIQSWTGSPLISTTPELRWGDQGIVTYDVDFEAMTLTFTMRDDIPDIYWHDGAPFTLDDLLFAYEIISHPDYTGIRFNVGIHFIEGAEERRAGEIEELTGAVLSEDGRVLTLHMTELPPSLPFFGMWSTPIPRHVWEGIEVADMDDHPYTRERLVGIGPFILQNIVPGESAYFIRNENYWRGAPYIESLVFESVPTATAALAMQEGHFDMMAFTLQNTYDFSHLNNIQILGQLAASGAFNSFILGDFYPADAEADLPDRFVSRGDRYDNPIQDNLVRHAIFHALDQLSISMTVNRGFTRPATSVLFPFNARQWMDLEHVGHAPHNPELANQLLDEAGLTARDAEGYRLDFNGNPWSLTWMHFIGPDIDIVFAVRQQALREVGVRLELWRGEFMDFQYSMDAIAANETQDADIVSQGWSFGWAPNPQGLWGINNFNRSRFITEEWEEIHENILSTEAWDPEFLGYWMQRWQEVFYRDAVSAPLTYGLVFRAVNNRVQNHDFTLGAATPPHLWRLTAETPYSHQ